VPRNARIVAPGFPHHITQRGNNKRLIFYDREDRDRYLEWLLEYSLNFNLTMLGYCLMDNHVHFVGVPHEDDSLARLFRILNTRYSHYINRKMGSSGHFWQGRYYSCIAKGPHFIQTLKYVERNPVRAGIVSMPWQWEWSSAAEHCGIRQSYFGGVYLDEYTGLTPFQWRVFIEASEETDSVYAIRRSTLSGSPIPESRLTDLPTRGRPKSRKC